MKLSPNLSLFQILSPRDWWILPDLNWRQNWFQLISLNRAHQKVCTGDIFEYPNVGNSVWFSIWYLITRSWLWFFVSKAHKILSFVAHSTASSRWFLDAHNFIPTLDHFNLYCLGLKPEFTQPLQPQPSLFHSVHALLCRTAAKWGFHFCPK